MSNLDTIIDFGSKNLRLGVFDQSSEIIYSSNVKIIENKEWISWHRDNSTWILPTWF